MEWIKIEDEVPRNKEEVLASDSDNEMLFGYMVYKDDTFQWRCETSDEAILNVTHWLKPELPNDLL